MAKTISTLDAALDAGIDATDAARDAFQRAAGLFEAILHLTHQASAQELVMSARHIVTLAREGCLLANDRADIAFCDCQRLIDARDAAGDKRTRRSKKSGKEASHA